MEAEKIVYTDDFKSIGRISILDGDSGSNPEFLVAVVKLYLTSSSCSNLRRTLKNNYVRG